VSQHVLIVGTDGVRLDVLQQKPTSIRIAMSSASR
jgi:hypothetical protein